MPDLSTMFPGTQPMGGFMGGYWQGQQQDQALQNNAINQRQALQDLYKSQQMLPLDMSNKEASTAHMNSQAKLGNVQAEAAQRKLDFDKRLEDQEYQSMIEKYAQQHSAHEINQTLAKIQNMMWSKDPQEVEAGKKMHAMISDVYSKQLELNQRGENSLAVARINQQGATERAGMRPGKGDGERVPRTDAEAQNYWDARATNLGLSQEERAFAATQVNRIQERRQALKAAGVPAWVQDPNGNYIPNPNKGRVPTTEPRQGESKPQHSLADVRKMYPGVSDDQLKAKYKAKFGVDLQ